jgi:septum formation protein
LRAWAWILKLFRVTTRKKLDDTRDPAVVAEELALGKAMDVATKFPDASVIGSDTIVTIDGRQLEKPIDEADARQMLRGLSGAGELCYDRARPSLILLRIFVYLNTIRQRSFLMSSLTTKLRAYVATGDPMDKAGGLRTAKNFEAR